MDGLFESIHHAKSRNKEKRQLVLNFLSMEGYSNLNNIVTLLGIVDKSGCYRLLRKLISENLIQKHTLKFESGDIALWGITEQGLGECDYDENSPPVTQAFEPSRIKFTTLNHTLMNQRVYLTLSKQGWHSWQNGDRQVFKDKYDIEHRPDAVFSTPTGVNYAIETELTLKTPARYRSILKSHIVAYNKGYWQGAVYVVKDDNFKKHLNRRFDNVKYIAFDESRQPFEHYRNDHFIILTLDGLKNLQVTR